MPSCGPDNCSSDGDLRLRDKSVGGVYRLEFPITKDGEDTPWTGIDSVSILFTRPDGTTVGPYEMVETDTDGTWYYQTLTTDFDTIGYWSLSLTVTDGSIVVEWPYRIEFRVRDQ